MDMIITISNGQLTTNFPFTVHTIKILEDHLALERAKLFSEDTPEMQLVRKIIKHWDEQAPIHGWVKCYNIGEKQLARFLRKAQKHPEFDYWVDVMRGLAQSEVSWRSRKRRPTIAHLTDGEKDVKYYNAIHGSTVEVNDVVQLYNRYALKNGWVEKRVLGDTHVRNLKKAILKLQTIDQWEAIMQWWEKDEYWSGRDGKFRCKPELKFLIEKERYIDWYERAQKTTEDVSEINDYLSSIDQKFEEMRAGCLKIAQGE